MEYRFTMTRRLFGIAVSLIVLLLLLFFLLGVQIGRNWDNSGESDRSGLLGLKNSVGAVIPTTMAPTLSATRPVPVVGSVKLEVKPPLSNSPMGGEPTLQDATASR